MLARAAPSGNSGERRATGAACKGGSGKECFTAPMVHDPPPRALVLLRVPRGAAPPGEEQIRHAIQDDRRRLGLSPEADGSYLLAGPYAIDISGQALDEYVAWEV